MITEPISVKITKLSRSKLTPYLHPWPVSDQQVQ